MDKTVPVASYIKYIYLYILILSIIVTKHVNEHLRVFHQQKIQLHGVL